MNTSINAQAEERKLIGKATTFAATIFEELTVLCAQQGRSLDQLFDDMDQKILRAAVIRAFVAGFEGGYREACEDSNTALAIRLVMSGPPVRL